MYLPLYSASSYLSKFHSTKENMNKGNAVCSWARQDEIADKVEMFIVFVMIFLKLLSFKYLEKDQECTT